MKIIYKCDTCGCEFSNRMDCNLHEIEHLQEGEEEAIKMAIYALNEDVCDYCDHSFYVYGCEQDCKFKKECNWINCYSNFSPVNPLHNKKRNGGI